MSGPANGTLVLNADGTFTYTPAASFIGIDSFEYEVSDGNGATATASVLLTINSIGSPPIANDDNFAILENGSLGADITANDSNIDADSTVSLVSGPNDGSLTLNPDGTFFYVHDGSESTSDSFIYELTNSAGVSSQATVSLSVTPTNDAPIANPDSLQASPGQSLRIDQVC